MVDQIRFFATAARHLEGKSAGEYMAGHTSFVRREPIGVCAQVAPWNYPMMMAVWKFAPAIAAGNTVVLKPSDTTPASTTLLAEIAAEFLPPGVFNVICGDRDTGRAMVEHPTPGDGVDHRLGARRHGGRRRRGRATSSGSTSSSAARRRSSCSTTPTSRPPSRASRSPATSTPARTARRRPGCSPGRASTATSPPPSPRRPRARQDRAARRRGRALRAGQQRRPARPGSAASSTGRPTTPASLAGGARQGDDRLLLRADRRRRPAPGRRDDPGRDLRPGDHRAALQRRGRGRALGQRRAVRPGVERVDEGLRPGDADGQAPRLRLRVDQHPHPARRRDAPRRLQALRLRQGPHRSTASRTTPASST